jgi:hypothetical protein
MNRAQRREAARPANRKRNEAMLKALAKAMARPEGMELREMLDYYEQRVDV